MSCFKNPRFAKELAYRTMVNYYLLKDRKPETEEHQSPELRRIIHKMESEGFETSLKYEVTLALNSMLGLLILPQQEYYSESSLDYNFGKLPTLESCMDDTSYKNTYEQEGKGPASIIRHMRNAVSHDRIMIIPESADNKNITHIRFRDAAFVGANDKLCAFRNDRSLESQIRNKVRNHETVYEFDLSVSVEKLEPLLMEIAEYLIDFAT